MAELLLELFSEEIPARMQSKAEEDLARLLRLAFDKHGLAAEEFETTSGPRRIAICVGGLPSHSAATIEERKGPRVGAPKQAIEGFLRAAGLDSVDQCVVIKDPKGDYYLARQEKAGQATAEIVAKFMPEVIQNFPWPKSMRWGERRLRWVRPLHSILCLLDGDIVSFEVNGIKSGRVTKGHRFLSDKNSTCGKTLTIDTSRDYAEKLIHAKVVKTRNERIKLILEGAHKIAREETLRLVEDRGLLEENAGLVEWPVVLSGAFDRDFLKVPQEILITAMKSHQKCFSLKELNSDKLANRFILVSNIEAENRGAAVIAGNERVIRARLSDAQFFWNNDRSHPLRTFASQLENVTFHEKLGTQLERVKRITKLATAFAPLVGANPEQTKEAAELCKADLVSATVGEFPELQGIIGRYIALEQGHSTPIADAIADHYKPQGPSDGVPREPLSIAVALADKFDMLIGFWAINERPTGSKDPFALRRAALGMIRLVLENNLRLQLFSGKPWCVAVHEVAEQLIKTNADQRLALPEELLKEMGLELGNAPLDRLRPNLPDETATDLKEVSTLHDLPLFFIERLKVYLRDQGARHDLIDAVIQQSSGKGQDSALKQGDLLMIVKRVEALGAFLETPEGASLLGLVRRALNILKIEEKKEGSAFVGKPSQKLLKNKQEKALNAAIKSVGKDVASFIEKDDFVGAMSSLAQLRAPVDTFFETVIVNADDKDMRENRLNLLNGIRGLTLQIADFSKIEG